MLVNSVNYGSISRRNALGNQMICLISRFILSIKEIIYSSYIRDHVQTLASSKLPTRIFLVCTTLVSPNILKNRNFLEIATIPRDFPLGLTEKTDTSPLLTTRSISLILAINKESMLIDPIEWGSFKQKLDEWAEKYCPNLEVSQLTDNLF